VASALAKWWTAWQERRQEEVRKNQPAGSLAEEITPCLQALLWAAGRLGVGEETLLAAAAAWPDDPYYRPLRLEAVTALASGRLTEPVLAALELAALGSDPEIRTVAAEAIGRHDSQRASRLAERLLSDRVSFNRLTRHKGMELENMLRTAAAQVHYQGVALPRLIAAGDIDGLTAVVKNRKLPEAARLGAVEGLALLAREDAEARLAEVGRDEKEDEDVRKAAWRGLRRSKRARAAAQQGRPPPGPVEV
jgi:ParB family chromosome partitioning protein